MVNGLLGKKVGMTQIFDSEGNVVPVTVVKTGPCFVLGTNEMTNKKVKLGYESIKESRLSRPLQGFFKKIGVSPLKYIQEFEATGVTYPPKAAGEEENKKDAKDEGNAEGNGGVKIGLEIKADLFRAGDFVDVSGISIGKGFQGGMRRWNWMGGPGGHGSMHHRRVGSIGSSADPSRTFRGRHMPGHMGARKITVQGLRVMKVDLENNLLLISGSIPGKKNNYLTVTLSKKKVYKSLDEKKVVHAVKRNPMKQSKSKAKGK
jgi:large subunit ribosomal protein L3